MLFVSPTNGPNTYMLHLYHVARGVILHVSNQDQYSPESSSHLPHYFTQAISIAAHCILRICRSPLRHHLDPKEAETTFHTAIELLKRIAVLDDDLHARDSMVLSQLWSSDKIFIGADDSQNGLRIDIRDRLVSLYFSIRVESS